MFIVPAQRLNLVMCSFLHTGPTGPFSPMICRSGALSKPHMPRSRLASEIRRTSCRVLAAHRRKKGTANNQSILPRRADAGRTSTTYNMRVWFNKCTVAWLAHQRTTLLAAVVMFDADCRRQTL